MEGALAMLLVSGVGSAWALRAGDRLVLGITGAREVGRDEEPVLHNVVEELAIAAGLPKPRVYVIETPSLNAFATGMSPRRAAICVTRGLLRRLNREELQGVIGHEMGHIVNWDIRYATAVAVLVGLIALVADGVLRALRHGAWRGRRHRLPTAGAVGALLVLTLFALLAPLSAKLVQMAISREREYLADATSVRLTRNPQGLISALQKIAASATPFPGANRATQHMFIVNPFRNFPESVGPLFATHPPIELRIRRLQHLGA